MRYLTTAAAGLLCLGFLSAPMQAQSDTTSHAQVMVHVRGGSVVIGTLVAEDSAHVTIRTDALGVLVIARDHIESIGDAHSRFAAPPPATADELPPPVFDASPSSQVEWRRTIRLSGNYTSGSVSGSRGETKGGLLAISIERKSDLLSLELALSAGYQITDPNPASVDESSFSLIASRKLPGAFSLRAETLIEHNAIDELYYRLFQSVGLGWTAIDKPKFTLLLTPGLGYTAEEGKGSEFFGPVRREKFKDDRGVALASFESATLRLTPAFTLTQDFFSFHAFDDRPRLQYTANVTLVGMMTRHVGMTVAYKREFDSDIPLPINKTLEKISLGLQFTF